MALVFGVWQERARQRLETGVGGFDVGNGVCFRRDGEGGKWLLLCPTSMN